MVRTFSNRAFFGCIGILAFLSGCVGDPVVKEVDKGLLFGGLERLSWPLRGPVSSYFGRRGLGRHEGIDIRAKRGTLIKAAAPGRVISSGKQRGYGLTIVVKHKRFKTLYAHCERISVSPGDLVRRGQTIGRVGHTGNAHGYHLHFEVRTERWVALNPLDYLPL